MNKLQVTILNLQVYSSRLPSQRETGDRMLRATKATLIKLPYGTATMESLSEGVGRGISHARNIAVRAHVVKLRTTCLTEAGRHRKAVLRVACHGCHYSCRWNKSSIPLIVLHTYASTGRDSRAEALRQSIAHGQC